MTYLYCATPNLLDLKEEGKLSYQGFSENNKITEDYSEESDNENSDNNDTSGLLTNNAAKKPTRMYHNRMAETINDKRGQTNNNKEPLKKNGSDYLLFHHIKDKLFQQKPVQQQAPVVNVYQTVSQQASNRETKRQREMEIVSAIRNDRLRERPWHRPKKVHGIRSGSL